ncbi:hypothetical protein [Bradyrhizobium cajani]|uniref:Uncharacterized protein n=1 Tax=Bradyrhizobium cajani TaxID=1928661 RepID=A0A844T839_9BRAD|nr:hypothetical protein [Bradyrhizobium cajani]MCP3367837.1 hypothetical protein [Bradyrhizobium cajani]MVT71672.1 hypothetical protein [Bradyrhizobium cajani]
MSEEAERELESAPVRSARKTSKARTLTEIRSLARSHTRTAIRVLVGIMRSDDATPAARVSAANAILDRGWGKAAQPTENGEEGAPELVQRIERVIVHPDNASDGDAGHEA